MKAPEERDNEVLEESGTRTLTNKKSEDRLQEEVASTSPTEGSISEGEEGGGGWLGGIGADFRTIAVSLKHTAGGVASFVHRSALSVANEIAHMEEDMWERGSDKEPPLRLPWEVQDGEVEGTYHEDSLLKEKILMLSQRKETFTTPFSLRGSPDSAEKDDDDGFILDGPRIHIINVLLSGDDDLSSQHARLSGRSDVQETAFWRNYFYHCDAVRREHLQQYEYEDDDTEEHSQDSLVPAEEDNKEESDDDDDDGTSSSYVCVGDMPSPPISTGMKSVDSMVVVDPPPRSGESFLS
jgi:hypothetical protein